MVAGEDSKDRERNHKVSSGRHIDKNEFDMDLKDKGYGAKSTWVEAVVVFLKTLLRLLPVVMVFIFVLLYLTVDIEVPYGYYILAIIMFVASFFIDRLIPEER